MVPQSGIGSYTRTKANGAAVDRVVPGTPEHRLDTIRTTVYTLRCETNAGVTQLVECLPSKQNVAGSSPVSRSNEACNEVNLRPFK
jgi:hypothetical protein